MPRVIRLLRLLLYFSLWKQLSDFRRREPAPMLALQDADMALNETRMLDVASTAMREAARASRRLLPWRQRMSGKAFN